jgi:hypothetical protein
MDAATLFLIGTGVQAGAKVSAGMAAQEAGAYNAQGLERQAAEERAAAGRAAGERRLEMERVLSRQRAIAAASGAGGGPSLLDIVGDTVERGEYRAQGERYLGESRARNLTDRANLARWEGENAFLGSIIEGAGTILTGDMRYRTAYGAPSGSNRVGPWRTTVTYR